MLLSQKCLYGLRSVFEIAKRQERGVVTVAVIAEAQAIPKRYLEGILNTLKGAGIVISLRGKNGGYILAKPPEQISVQEIIKLMNGTLTLVDCDSKKNGQRCPLKGGCAFSATWEKAQQAMEDVFRQTSISDLIEQEKQNQAAATSFYEI